VSQLHVDWNLPTVAGRQWERQIAVGLNLKRVHLKVRIGLAHHPISRLASMPL
jgi:hypothetical protein